MHIFFGGNYQFQMLALYLEYLFLSSDFLKKIIEV